MYLLYNGQRLNLFSKFKIFERFKNLAKASLKLTILKRKLNKLLPETE